jgi:glutathione synthase/RimK-type ligase-like ATP-grasp enzyme
MNIGVIVEKRFLMQEMAGAMIGALKARGIKADIICPQDGQFNPEDGMFISGAGERFDLNCYDVLLSRNRNGLGLAMLSYADAANILTINTSFAIQQVRNKAKMAIILSRSGVPYVPTILAENVSTLSHLPEEWFPFMLKPTYGSSSEGLRLIRRRSELADVHCGDAPILAQRYLPNNGLDLKLYVCGRKVFAVRRPSPFNGDPTASHQSIEVDSGMVELALRCGEIFGLDIYGVNATETPDGLAVREVNDFPNFTNVPGAADEIADYVLSRLDGEVGLSGASAFPGPADTAYGVHTSTSSSAIADFNARLAKLGARIDLVVVDLGNPRLDRRLATA